ncbi:hypothetical protein Q8A67_020171 [Cirrhinus molitorella]|uniref:Uncharacterized protein n=1 Tax=Cirrhinus molitorella TaxID=172907 RepID=A0AA88P9U2_9TELE|nr:hypothetical protein Q8A67_020171 [Cirrhinus molitorella]
MYSNTQRKGSNTVLERHEETVMSADNVVLMFMLVLTFVAVCQANEYISVRCDDVTGSVGKKVHFTCSVSLHTICCIRKYSFQYPKIYNDSAICRDYPVNPCKQWNSFTCRYTPTKAMTEQFRFFVNTHCGVDTTEFTVDIREPLKFEPANEAPGKKGIGIEVFVISGKKGSNTVEETVMSADNVVLLFMLVLTFVAVCQADEHISVSCDDVTGSVGKELNFTCNVSLHNTECCIKKYKFQYPETYNDIESCKDSNVNACKQWNRFTCRYTPTTAMTAIFRFLVFASCGKDKTYITVDIKEPLKHETATEAPGKKGNGTEAFIISGVSCFIIIIIVMAVFCVKRLLHPLKIKSMNAVNAVQLFIVVWTFTAVCQADVDFCSVTCHNVTESVGNEAQFTCSVLLLDTGCCIKLYKFQYPKHYNDNEICKEMPLVNACNQRNSFTCRYTPTTAMTEQFRFFVQTLCGICRTEFTVGATAPMKHQINTEAPGKKEEPIWDISETSKQKKFKIAVIAAVISCFIIAIMPVIYKITQKQNKTFLATRQDEDNCSHPENVI